MRNKKLVFSILFGCVIAVLSLFFLIKSEPNVIQLHKNASNKINSDIFLSKIQLRTTGYNNGWGRVHFTYEGKNYSFITQAISVAIARHAGISEQKAEEYSEVQRSNREFVTPTAALTDAKNIDPNFSEDMLNDQLSSRTKPIAKFITELQYVHIHTYYGSKNHIYSIDSSINHTIRSKIKNSNLRKLNWTWLHSAWISNNLDPDSKPKNGDWVRYTIHISSASTEYGGKWLKDVPITNGVVYRRISGFSNRLKRYKVSSLYKHMIFSFNGKKISFEHGITGYGPIILDLYSSGNFTSYNTQFSFQRSWLTNASERIYNPNGSYITKDGSLSNKTSKIRIPKAGTRLTISGKKLAAYINHYNALCVNGTTYIADKNFVFKIPAKGKTSLVTKRPSAAYEKYDSISTQKLEKIEASEKKKQDANGKEPLSTDRVKNANEAVNYLNDHVLDADWTVSSGTVGMSTPISFSVNNIDNGDMYVVYADGHVTKMVNGHENIVPLH
ncbi:hypothetical protein R5P67_01525 [Oenococcus oeni]